ncbi:uncharacterized protein LOC117108628 [Anneissia japonica]|uniref:uncharacterized protein LOC117108628 n=1 Tax=Anneissia japonica TaxID=1529436 RepID=UPI001425698A|nr:uncharacterized protein LOC117108628 [Anneissia japonica]XP_033106608.1 uncharacterized protein LOC117108628 [Anneissia japonica]
MKSLRVLAAITVFLSFEEISNAYNCKKDSISESVGCECNEAGYCKQGSVPVDPWMEFALKTQRDIQIDDHLNHLQIFDAHNAYNNRASGYGENDSCTWPPPYKSRFCANLANQEFTFTDMLNLGVRGLEIDNWYCYNAMRMAHSSSEVALSCLPRHRLLRFGLQEINQWLSRDGNENEILRIYINEKFNQTHDMEMNKALADFLGNRMLTPSDLRDRYDGIWPTAREMIRDGKTVVVATGSTAGSGLVYTHGDVYIHPLYWLDQRRKYFTDYPECGGKTQNNALRFYSDSTHYGIAYDGPTQVGTIQDLTEFVKCRIQFPAVDPVTPQVMATAVFTWASGQPKKTLTEESCVYLDTLIGRWFTPENCGIELHFACQNITDRDEWVISDEAGPYDGGSTACKIGFTFSIPQNGYRQQKVIEAALGSHENLWINYTPWLPTYSSTTPSSVATSLLPSIYFLLSMLGLLFNIRL